MKESMKLKTLRVVSIPVVHILREGGQKNLVENGDRTKKEGREQKGVFFEQ